MNEEETYEKDWKPLLYTNGVLDEEKVKNEMIDLIYIYEQACKIYPIITGGRLSCKYEELLEFMRNKVK